MSPDVHAWIENRQHRLRLYLPAQLAEPLIANPCLATARPCDAHLDALLHTVSTYLPRYLVGELMSDPRPGQVSGRFREATIMFADISGFTAMSERLSVQGEQGAEKITNIVGDYFTRLLDIAARYGGDLLKFGGDALLVAFFGDDDPATVDHTVNACQAAARMQEAIARFSEVEAFGEVFRLKMTTGLGSGPLFTANLGTAAKMEYTVMGQALTHMAYAEDQAEGGEIFVDGTTYQAVRPHIRVGEVRNGCYLITEVEDGVLPDVQVLDLDGLIHAVAPGDGMEAMASHLTDNIARLDALVPFLPPGLLDLLRFDPLGMASRERGEFRPVTVFFANFYGIDEIIEQLGPSKAVEITAILNAHFSDMQEIINRYEGVIDKVDSYVVGHRIMALFGAPRAHVDDPERAVRAAWEMQAAMSVFRELDTSAGTFTLKQRIGINTGRVFAGNVGSDVRHEYSVMGDEVNLTARLMSAAMEGQVLISQSTADQVGTRFRLDEQAPVRVKGKSQPVPNYSVRGVVRRHQTGELIHRSPLIGRQGEWGTIWQVAQKAMQGACQVLDIHGEMGMGKSRIIEELVAEWTQQGRISFFATCLSYGRHTPYAPWSALLRDLFGLREDDSDQERREKINGRLAAANPEWIDWAALVANLLSVPMDESDLLRSVDPKLRQQNLQRIVASLLASEAAYHPTLVVIDDLQWMDEASLALLNYVTTHIRSRPLLICVAYRPEEPIDLAGLEQSGYTACVLPPLSEENSLALLQSQLPTEPEMPQRLQQIILKNAQGNPLFIVEMAHALIENYLSYDAAIGVYRAREDLDRVQVPDTVSRVILSRLDRLDEASRNMLKVASAIGRVFQQWLLQSVYPFQTSKAELEGQLLALVQKEILDHAPSTADVVYLYRHVMTREVAYESLLYAERRQLHFKIARSIEEQAESRAGRIDEFLEVLADHYTLAEDWPQALTYHLKAARRAQAIYANQDAIHRYRKALEIVEHIPDALRERQAAYEGLGDTYELAGRYDEALESYARAGALLDEMAALPDAHLRRADLCRRTAWVYERKSDYATAHKWIGQGLESLGDSTNTLEAARLYLLRVGVYQRQGKYQEATQWGEHAIQVTEQVAGAQGAQEMAHAAYLMGEIYRRQGNYDQAAAFAQRSLDIYRQLENIVGQGEAHNTLANVYFEQSHWQASMEHYRQSLAIKERVGDIYGQGALSLNIGEIYRITGQLEQAIAFYRRSLQVWEELGVTYGKGLTYTNLGAAYLRIGDLEQATRHLEQSEALFAQVPSEDFVAENSRYRAEVALHRGALDEATALALHSLRYAIDQGLRADECATRRVLGAICIEQDNLEHADRYLSESLDIARELDDRYEMGRIMFQMGLLQCRQNRGSLVGDRIDQACTILHQAKTIFEELRAELDLRQVTEAILRLGGIP